MHGQLPIHSVYIQFCKLACVLKKGVFKGPKQCNVPDQSNQAAGLNLVILHLSFSICIGVVKLCVSDKEQLNVGRKFAICQDSLKWAGF